MRSQPSRKALAPNFLGVWKELALAVKGPPFTLSRIGTAPKLNRRWMKFEDFIVTTTNEADQIRRAFARIGSIRANLPMAFDTEEAFVREYNDALHHLKEAGFDVTDFLIPEHWLEH